MWRSISSARSPLISPHLRAGQKLELQNVRRFKRKRVGIQPLPDQLDFLDGQDPIARGASLVRRQPSGRIGLDDVLRQRPAKHCRANLPALFRFPPLALVGDGVQELADVTPANIGGISLKDGRQGAPQTALDRLGCAQAANNSPSQIEVDQLLDRNP